MFAVGIFDADGNLLAVDGAGPDETVTVSATAEQDGTHYVLVVVATEDAAGSYSLTLLEEDTTPTSEGTPMITV